MNVEESIRFYDWIHSKRVMPTAEDVMTHFEVSRATAFRRLSDFRMARGIVQARDGVHRIGRFIPVPLPERTRPFPAWLYQHQGMTTE